MSEARAIVRFEPAVTNLPDTLELRGISAWQAEAMALELQAMARDLRRMNQSESPTLEHAHSTSENVHA